MSGALAPYRVLDLTTERGWFAGKLLADLGADVIKVEPPGGDPGRLRGPFAGDVPGPENGLTWWADNRGKRSMTLDLSGEREAFLGLVAGADAVIESFDPGTLESLGLALPELAVVTPRLVLTRITPFGQDGPYAHYKADDLILAAMGGPAGLTGDADRPPVRITAPQYFRHAAAEAAVHTVVALHHAARTGRGQQVDVSAQTATVRTLMNAMAHPATGTPDPERTTFGEPRPVMPFRTLYRCADGYVVGALIYGPGLPGFRRWLREAGFPIPAFLDEPDDAVLKRLGARPPEGFADRVSAVLAEFFAARPKAWLAEEALAHRLMLVAVNDLGDIRRDPQLAARGYFRPLPGSNDDPGADSDEADDAVHFPTRWAHLSGTPLVETGRAPRVGEHDAEIRREIDDLPRADAHGGADREEAV